MSSSVVLRCVGTRMKGQGRGNDADIVSLSYRPENIPHLSQQQSAGTPVNENGPRGSISGAPALHPTNSGGSGGQAGSPVKEHSILQRGMSVDEGQPGQEATAAPGDATEGGLPIRNN